MGFRDQRAVLACMRNEGQFLLEWLSYQFEVGFDRVIVCTNDCNDGTDEMLDRLSRIAPVVHLDNPRIDGGNLHIQANERVLNSSLSDDLEWLLHCDADEFLCVSAGEGKVDDLIRAVGPADAIAIAWRCFGSGGRKVWNGESVLESQITCAHAPRDGIDMHKTLFRPDRFRSGDAHMPKRPVSDNMIVKNTAGSLVNPRALFVPSYARYRGMSPDQMTWENACLNHYAIRSEDIFLLKNVRGDAVGPLTGRYRVGSVSWRRFDKNRRKDLSMRKFLPGVRARIDGWIAADPELARLNARAFEWFKELRARFLTDEQRAAWIVTPDPSANAQS